jgi:hypothetical protein
MQKALILALLIGAFLLPRYVIAQTPEELCSPTGGTYVNHSQLGPICAAAAPFEPMKQGICSGYLVPSKTVTGKTNQDLYSECTSYATSALSGQLCIQNLTPTPTGVRFWQSVSPSPTSCATIWNGPFEAFVTNIQTIESASCPPMGAPDLTGSHGEGENHICFSSVPSPQPQDCPTEPGPNPIFYIGQQGGGTACIEEDNGSICPYVEDPNTPGYYTADFANPQSCAGQQPEEPDLKPDCTEGGNGMTVCKADPDDKCTVNSTGLLSCEANCGYINGQFYCPSEPDIPEIPDPEISDDIQDPNKPMGDMVKQDFKDVLVGAETRLSSIKKELEDVQISNDKNTDKLSDKLTGLGAKVDQVNRNLVGIQGTLDDTLYGEQLEIDSSGFQDEINQGLGVTGDESLEDLEGEPISLDDFSGNFQFSLGSSACPADRQINILGQAHSISWQPFCDVFSFIGVLVQISAYVLSLFIVFGGRK